MTKKTNIVTIDEYSIEREIAEVQLERLRITSRERLLTYEEVKIYDLLTKNLLLAKDRIPESIPTTATVIETTEELVKIAQESVIKKVSEFMDEPNEPAKSPIEDK